MYELVMAIAMPFGIIILGVAVFLSERGKPKRNVERIFQTQILLDVMRDMGYVHSLNPYITTVKIYTLNCNDSDFCNKIHHKEFNNTFSIVDIHGSNYVEPLKVLNVLAELKPDLFLKALNKKKQANYVPFISTKRIKTSATVDLISYLKDFLNDKEGGAY